MKTERILLVVAVVLGVFSLVNTQWEVLPNRWLRILTSAIFLVPAIIIVGLQKLWGLLIFVSLVVCDFLLLKWEVMISKYAYYSLHSLVALSLILLTIRGMKWQKISWFEICSVVLFLIFSSFVLLALREFFNIEDVLLKILFNINGFLLVILVVLSFFSGATDSTLLGPYFFWGVLGLVLSELIMFIIYFLEAPNFRYIDNFFYVIGLYFLLKVSLENTLIKKDNFDLKKEQEWREVQDSPEGGF